MAFKPFELQAPKTGRWNRYMGVAPVKPHERPLADFSHLGKSLSAVPNGVRSFRRLGVQIEPEKMARKELTTRQKSAGHCKFLEEQGWDRKRISQFLDVKRSFVDGVLSCMNYRYVPAIKPPDFAQVTA